MPNVTENASCCSIPTRLLWIKWFKFESSSKGSIPFVIFRHSFKSMQGRLRPSPGTLLHQQKNILYIYICCGHLWRYLKLFEKGSKPPHWALVCFGWFSGAMSEGPLCWSKIIPRGTQNTFLVSWIEVAAYAMLRKQEFDWSGHIVGLCAMRCKNL